MFLFLTWLLSNWAIIINPHKTAKSFYSYSKGVSLGGNRHLWQYECSKTFKVIEKYADILIRKELIWHESME